MRLGVALVLAVAFLAAPTSALSPLDDDAGSGRDAGDTAADAVPVTPGVLFTGRLTRAIDEQDYYSFSTLGRQAFVASRPVEVVSPDGSHHTADPSCDFPVFTAPGVAKFSLQLGPLTRVPIADYDFIFTLFDIPEPNDAGSGRDASTWDTDPVPLPDGTSTGFLGFGDDGDTYTFPIEEGETVFMDLDGDAVSLQGYYQPGISTVIHGIRDGATYTAPEGGVIIISLLAGCGGGSYTLTLERM